MPGQGSRRPYFSYSQKELRSLFESHKEDMKTLRALAAELKHRSRPKALALAREVEAALAGKEGAPANPEQGCLPLGPLGSAKRGRQPFNLEKNPPLVKAAVKPEEEEAARKRHEPCASASEVPISAGSEMQTQEGKADNILKRGLIRFLSLWR